MRFFLTILAGLAVFGMVGCSGASTNTAANMTNNSNIRTNSSNSNMNSSNINTSNSTSGMNSATTDFMTKAAQGGTAEVELGKMAVSKVQNADVKKFAQQMIEDHSKTNADLKQLAAKKNVTLPTDVGADHKATMDDLSKLSGAEFDKKYVDAMVKDHEKTVDLFQDEADKGADADVKAFATKTLPTLKMHLEMIKSIQSKMK